MKKKMLKSILVGLATVAITAGSASALTVFESWNDVNNGQLNDPTTWPIFTDMQEYEFGSFNTDWPGQLEANMHYELNFDLQGETIGTWDTSGLADYFYVTAYFNGDVVGSSVTQYTGVEDIKLHFELTALNTPPTNLVIKAWADVTGIDEKWAFRSANLDGTSSPVPEPTTMLLFGSGLAGLAGVARRKRK